MNTAMPFLRKIFIKTYGCQMNAHDSERLAAMLRTFGHEIVDCEDDADVYILNTCSVRERAEIKAVGKSRYLSRKKLRKNNALLGIVGCMAENLAENLFKLNPGIDFIIGPRRISELPAILAGENVGRVALLGEAHSEDAGESARDFSSAKICASVSIMQGCNMRCSYCIVPKTRGPESYRPMDSIIAECETLVQNGTKEITLLGQIVNNYGQGVLEYGSGKSPFVQLLERIDDIAGLERIRYMSPHPKGFREDLIEAHSSLSKLCPSVHLPIQSGSDRVLRAMRRPYTRARILSIVESLRAAVPNIALTTDVIVGYPGEREEDFSMTVDLLNAVKFNMAFVFKYSPRAGTLSASLPDDVGADEKDRRNKILLDMVQKCSIGHNETMIGHGVEVLVEGHAKRGENKLCGRTRGGDKVIFDGQDRLIGQLVNVKIMDSAITILRGKLIEI
ncbi:MAG: tRNA (N6-isopentenyl adenosine(37)-C2)-methylthiotransferase MiaB [Puniceicoccales bacterium]|jgi:tRNA-2-methylthio-N6-dimethylallyladenosine synthase|nr:tRNA (N6-isopentenyl adenosine(37)-C2)-methylthiotransferase MiaB [Puniceicoccales bacterium]